MKTLVIIGGLLFCGGGARAQKAPAVGVESAASFKGANAIAIHTADSTKVAYNKLAKGLLAAGYEIGGSDKELLYINTSYQAVQDKGVQVALHFAVIAAPSGSVIQARGKLKIPGLDATIAAGDTPIEKRGMNGSAYMLAWNELDKAALTYPNGRVGYLKKP